MDSEYRICFCSIKWIALVILYGLILVATLLICNFSPYDRNDSNRNNSSTNDVPPNLRFNINPHHDSNSNSTFNNDTNSDVGLIDQSLTLLDHETRIVGGVPVQDGEYPFFVYPIGMMLCGATLIYPEYVISMFIIYFVDNFYNICSMNKKTT
jgi:hypothetical protein